MRWMVQKARDDAFFLGRMLSEYQETSDLDDLALAAALQCTPKALSRLVLCRCPDDQTDTFGQEVQAIAAFADCNADALMQVVRQVAAIRALRAEDGQFAGGLLMAARDRHDHEHEEKPGGPGARKRRGPRK